ncbi:MAG: succinate dehydrogenase/fumarate reductase flavoprotein subunit [Actinomycetia bacterium]|nr:succinate dehydrogenase/fumarate reductase flavoprotein subunit [Actinomycetes bacterium]
MSERDSVAAIEPVAERDVGRYDDAADVVVVGLGCAGASAAISASERGLDVLGVERQSAPGGTSAMSGGLIYLGGGTPVQHECGFDDDADTMYAFLVAATAAHGAADASDRPDLAKLRRYCDESVDHFHWLVDHGVPFRAAFCDEPNRESPDDSGLVFSGGEDSRPFCDLARPAPRGHKPQFTDSAGNFLMQCLADAVGKTATRTMVDARVDRLVVDDDGAVVGVAVRADNSTRHIRARRGVVLAAGGFAYNEAMLAANCPEAMRPDPAWRIGTDADDGRGIRLAQGAGGAPLRLDVFECALPLGPPHRLCRAILVDRRGRRFVNEDTYTGRIGWKALMEHDGDVFMVLDDSIYERNLLGLRFSYAAETVEELARDMGVPAAELAATIARYNEHAAHGDDPDFGKLPPFVQPLVPPLGAIDLGVQRGAIYATFTLGGLHTDVDGRVLSSDGRAVAGLFAAGRTSASLAAGGYVSGISLGDGTFFGRRAGGAV